MTLDEVLARYDAAAHVRIEHHIVGWPEMQAILRVARSLRRQVHGAGVSRALEGLIVDLWKWTWRTAGRPMSVEELASGAASLAADLRRHIETGLDSRLDRELKALEEELRVLAAGAVRHPGGACIEGIVARYDREGVYFAASAHDVDAVRAWLSEEELHAEVLEVSELRSAPIRDGLVLIGPPYRYFVSRWCPPERAARVSGWLLTAPPARTVHVVTWPGHGALDAAKAALFPSTPPLTLARFFWGETREADTGPEMCLSSAVAPVAPIRPKSEWVMDRERVEAVGFHLAGGSIAFFAEHDGPEPEVVRWDSRAVQVSRVGTGGVSVGTVLLFRPDRSAGNPQLYQLADRLLSERLGGDAVCRAHAAKAELKHALSEALARQGYESLHYQLTARVNSSEYARHILQSIPDPSYIAPERPGAYDAVRAVLRMPPDQGGRQYALLSALRAACRQAGTELTNDLIEVLRSSTEWQRDLDANGVARVAATELGGLELRAVVGVDAERHRVGRSRLGRLLNL